MDREGFVSGGGYDVGVGDGVRREVCRNEAGDMGHVDHEIGAHFFGDLGEEREVQMARIRREAGDDHARFVLQREGANFVHVDAVRILADTVGNDVEPFSTKTDGGAVRKVAAMSQVHCENRITRFAESEVGREVRLCACMWLYVGVLCAEELFRSIDRELFDFVDHLVSAVVATCRVAFGIFVGQDRADRF